MEISKSGLRDGNPLDRLKLCYILNSDKLRDVFEKVKIQVQDEKDIEMLAKIVNNKVDTTGQLRDPENEESPLVFDTMTIINGMKFSEEDKAKCQVIKFID